MSLKILEIDGLEELTGSNGLDNHKMCTVNIQILLSSSKSYQHRPEGLTMIGSMVKDVASETSPNTFSEDTFASMDYEVRDEEPRKRLLMCSIACPASFPTPRPVPNSEDQTVPEDQPTHEPVHAVGCKWIATSWTPWSPQEEQWTYLKLQPDPSDNSNLPGGGGRRALHSN